MARSKRRKLADASQSTAVDPPARMMAAAQAVSRTVAVMTQASTTAVTLLPGPTASRALSCQGPPAASSVRDGLLPFESSSQDLSPEELCEIRTNGRLAELSSAHTIELSSPRSPILAAAHANAPPETWQIPAGPRWDAYPSFRHCGSGPLLRVGGPIEPEAELPKDRRAHSLALWDAWRRDAVLARASARSSSETIEEAGGDVPTVEEGAASVVHGAGTPTPVHAWHETPSGVWDRVVMRWREFRQEADRVRDEVAGLDPIVAERPRGVGSLGKRLHATISTMNVWETIGCEGLLCSLLASDEMHPETAMARTLPAPTPSSAARSKHNDSEDELFLPSVADDDSYEWGAEQVSCEMATDRVGRALGEGPVASSAAVTAPSTAATCDEDGLLQLDGQHGIRPTSTGLNGGVEVAMNARLMRLFDFHTMSYIPFGAAGSQHENRSAVIRGRGAVNLALQSISALCLNSATAAAPASNERPQPTPRRPSPPSCQGLYYVVPPPGIKPGQPFQAEFAGIRLNVMAPKGWRGGKLALKLPQLDGNGPCTRPLTTAESDGTPSACRPGRTRPTDVPFVEGARRAQPTASVTCSHDSLASEYVLACNTALEAGNVVMVNVHLDEGPGRLSRVAVLVPHAAASGQPLHIRLQHKPPVFPPEPSAEGADSLPPPLSARAAVRAGQARFAVEVASGESSSEPRLLLVQLPHVATESDRGQTTTPQSDECVASSGSGIPRASGDGAGSTLDELRSGGTAATAAQTASDPPLAALLLPSAPGGVVFCAPTWNTKVDTSVLAEDGTIGPNVEDDAPTSGECCNGSDDFAASSSENAAHFIIELFEITVPKSISPGDVAIASIGDGRLVRFTVPVELPTDRRIVVEVARSSHAIWRGEVAIATFGPSYSPD